MLVNANASAGSRPFGDHRLTRSQMDALFFVAHGDGPLTPGALARRLGLTPGAVTQLVTGLREANLLKQTTHPGDARARILILTTPAARMLANFEDALAQTLEPRFAELSTEELAVLADLLGRADAEP